MISFMIRKMSLFFCCNDYDFFYIFLVDKEQKEVEQNREINNAENKGRVDFFQFFYSNQNKN